MAETESDLQRELGDRPGDPFERGRRPHPSAKEYIRIGLILAALWATAGVPSWLCLLLGAMGGLANVPLAATYQASVRQDARGERGLVRLHLGCEVLYVFGLGRIPLVLDLVR